MGWISSEMFQFSNGSNAKQIQSMNMADTIIMKDRVEGSVLGVNNVIVYGGVLGNIENCENVYIIGGNALGDLNNNGMVVECDDAALEIKARTTKTNMQNNNLFHDPITISPYT